MMPNFHGSCPSVMHFVRMCSLWLETSSRQEASDLSSWKYCNAEGNRGRQAGVSATLQQRLLHFRLQKWILHCLWPHQP